MKLVLKKLVHLEKGGRGRQTKIEEFKERITMFEKGRQPKRKRQDLEEKKSINRGPASKEGKVEILKTENFEQ